MAPGRYGEPDEEDLAALRLAKVPVERRQILAGTSSLSMVQFAKTQAGVQGQSFCSMRSKRCSAPQARRSSASCPQCA